MCTCPLLQCPIRRFFPVELHSSSVSLSIPLPFLGPSSGPKMLCTTAARNMNGSTEKATRAVREESRRGERRNGAKTNSFWSKLKFYCWDTSYKGRGRGPDSRRIISGPVERCTCVAPQVPAVGVAERMSRKLHPWASRLQAGWEETTEYQMAEIQARSNRPHSTLIHPRTLMF